MNDKKTPHITVVSPIYRCSEAIAELCRRLHITLSSITNDYEIILVNDSSPDDSWEIIKNMTKFDSRVKGINLSRNFGQHYAITAGLDYAAGDWIIVMDGDLQDLPEEITKLYETAKSGFDLVVGLRTDRKDGVIKKYLSKLFYMVFNSLNDSKINNQIGNFGIYSSKVIKSMSQLREQNRSFGLFAVWVGFRRSEISINHAERPYGSTSYTLTKMMKLAFDSIISHSDKLLRFSISIGLVISLISAIVIFYIILKFIFFDISVIGWTSLIVSIYLMGGFIMGAVGIMGIYIGKIFNEVKNRPLYVIQETTFKLNNIL